MRREERHPRGRSGLAVAFCAVLLLSGCISLSRGEREDLRMIGEAGLRATDRRAKSPGTAALPNILPGGGNFYLAWETDETDMWLVGFV